MLVNSLIISFKERPTVFKITSGAAKCSTTARAGWTAQNTRWILGTWKTAQSYAHHGPIVLDGNGQRRNYTLNLIEMTFNRKVLIGTWSEKDLLIVTKRFTQIDAVILPQDGKLIVSTILEEPYMMLKKPETGRIGNDRYEGFCVELLEKLSEKGNFTYEIKLVGDGKYGVMDPNTGQWNGMIGELVRKEADLVVAPLTITFEREKVVDFTKPFMAIGISIVIKKPVKTQPGVFSFLAPLSYDIWICIIFAYLGVSVVLFLVSRFSPYEWHIEETFNGPVVVNEFSMYNTLWFSLGAFMQQGGHIYPRSVSGRLAGSVWWFFTLIIISSYTANLAAFLTVGRMSTPIKGADDLSKQSEIEYGMYKSGSTSAFFKRSQVYIHKTMNDFMNRRPHVLMGSNGEGFARVRSSKGKYAFLAESSVVDYANNRAPCDTMKVGDELDSKGYGIATQAGSLLTEKISRLILDLKEDGTLAQMQREWWIEKGECGPADADKGDSKNNELKLNNVAGCFYILIIGLVLSLVFALLEFLYKANKDSRRHGVPMKQAIKTKARFSVQGGAFKDPRDLYPSAFAATVKGKDGVMPPFFRKSLTQV
ncbi:Glutamate receptor 2 [Hypsibius exemplaris]|uniref:Glutamate receptor 2 n=1 Tax=Hypsibius exemplaris TaxID=2072580 RepID=A0A9X6NBM1_HYPEX|nr:Glutamate receptor 2 [Hypsibius exemplaris]